MTKLTISVTTTGAVLTKVFIDHDVLPTPGGTGSAMLQPGQHALTWVVLGAPGDSYTIAITAPAAAAWTNGGTLDSSGKDAGLHWVEV